MGSMEQSGADSRRPDRNSGDLPSRKRPCGGLPGRRKVLFLRKRMIIFAERSGPIAPAVCESGESPCARCGADGAPHGAAGGHRRFFGKAKLWI